LYQSPIPVRRTLFYYLRRIARKSREFGIKINLIDKDTKPFVKSIYRESFQIFKNKKRVPANIWSNRDWIVEKFLPETEGSQYVVRNAYFLGSKMIFYKSFSSDPIVKESEEKMGTSEVINAHEEIIQFREKIGLDYGKIDYVMHKNKPIVLDVAKTVGGAYGLDLAKFLAPGIDDYL